MACEIEDTKDIPVCSDSLKVLKNNVKIMDQYINSEEFEVPDRLGIPRKTWAGLEKDVQDALVNLDPRIEQLIAEKIIAQGGIEIANEFGDSLEKVINQHLITDALTSSKYNIHIPSDFPSISDAVGYISVNPYLHNKNIVIDVESGHVENKKIIIKDIDLRSVEISSQSIIKISGNIDSYIEVRNAISPVFNILFDAQNNVQDGFNVQNNSTLYISNRKGILNCSARNIYLNNSSDAFLDHVIATNDSLSTSIVRNIWISRNSTAVMNGAECSGATDYNVWVSRSSNAYGESCKFSNAGIASVGATRFSVASFNLSETKDSKGIAVSLSAFVYMNDLVAINITDIPLLANENGVITCRNADITLGEEVNYYVDCRNNSQIAMQNSRVAGGFKNSAILSWGNSSIEIDSTHISGSDKGIVFDCRGNSRITGGDISVTNAGALFMCRNSSLEIPDCVFMSNKASGRAEQMSKVNMIRSKITSNEDSVFSIFGGSNMLVTQVSVNDVDIDTSNTNVNTFNSFSERGAVFK